ncbi:MAG: J domain-containing protein [Candidatus Micrarchaeia archaeon]|jgi:hypothetical protein
MPPSAPKAPAEPEWDLLRQKKPTLSTEHIECIAELSEAYLQPEATEFSEEDLISNLQALWKLSTKGNARMKAGHARKIIGMVAAICSTTVIPDTTKRELKKNTVETVQRTFHGKSDLLEPEGPNRLSMFGKARAAIFGKDKAKKACAKLEKLVKNLSKELGKAVAAKNKEYHKRGGIGNSDPKYQAMIEEMVKYDCQSTVVENIYNEIPMESKFKIRAKSALADYIFTGFDTSMKETDSAKALMRYARIGNKYRDDLEELNNPELIKKRKGKTLLFGRPPFAVQQRVYKNIRTNMEFIERDRGREGASNSVAYETASECELLVECAKLVRSNTRSPYDEYELDFREMAFKELMREANYLFNDTDVAKGALIWAKTLEKLSPELYEKENIDNLLWKAWEGEIKNHAAAAKYGLGLFLENTLKEIRENCPQFADRADRLAADILEGRIKGGISPEQVKRSLLILEFGDNKNVENLSFNEIKKQYRKLTHKFHPDKHPGANAEELEELKKKTQDLNEAYALLNATKKSHEENT